MFPKVSKSFHPHNHNPKEKGCTIDYNGLCKFLKPGDRYRDMRGVEYYIAEDGSQRRADKEKK